MTGRRCRGSRAGKSSRADDRAVADASRELAGNTSGRSGGGELPMAIERGSTHGTMPFAFEFLLLLKAREKPLARTRRDEILRIAQLDSVLTREAFGAAAGHHHMR